MEKMGFFSSPICYQLHPAAAYFEFGKSFLPASSHFCENWSLNLKPSNVSSLNFCFPRYQGNCRQKPEVCEHSLALTRVWRMLWRAAGIKKKKKKACHLMFSFLASRKIPLSFLTFSSNFKSVKYAKFKNQKTQQNPQLCFVTVREWQIHKL